MASGHPRDEYGRVLPHPWWPEGRDAPGELELVRRFCNSVNRENGAERFATAVGFDAWLVSEGLDAARPSATELTRIIAVREALHDLVVANATQVDDPVAWDRLAALLAGAPLGIVRSPAGVTIAATGGGAHGFLARIGSIVATAVADDTWGRLKACRHCHWVVYDPSKNRSSRWCSMSACGGRHNAREYRRRQSRHA